MEHSIRSHFREEHAALERSLERLRSAAEGADRENLVRDWERFEAGLTAHLEAEERHLFPVLEADHGEAVAASRAAHVRIRQLLDDLGVKVQLHSVRLEEVDEFLAILEAHKEQEDQGLYRAADARLDAPARQAAIARAA